MERNEITRLRPPEPLNLELPARAESAAEARAAVSDYARTHGADANALATVVSEAVANAIRHAFPFGEDGRISIHAEIEAGNTLVLTVSDDGVGMRPDPMSGGLGLGLPLMGKLADSVEIESARKGTRLSVRFHLARRG